MSVPTEIHRTCGDPRCNDPDHLETRAAERYPCYCLPGVARCDDPYNWCDRVEQLESIRERALRMADEYGREPLIGSLVASALRAAVNAPLVTREAI